MLRVFQESRRVIVDLGGRKRDILLPLLPAAKFEGLLREKIELAEREPPELLTQTWRLKVLSFDRLVTIRLWAPDGETPERLPLTVEAARWLADRVRFCIQQAAFGMRFVTANEVSEGRHGLREKSYSLHDPA